MHVSRFPGEEFFEVLTWSQLGIQRKGCGLLNIDGYYDPLLAMVERALADGFVRVHHGALLLAGADPEQLLDRLTSDADVAVDTTAKPPLR